MAWLWLVLSGCGEQVAEPEPEPVPDRPSADDILQRHLTGTNQCRVLTAPNYMFRWEAVVTNGKAVGYGERVVQQGTQGKSFTRIHERANPNWGFSAVGRTLDGAYWSASDAGVVSRIEGDAVTAQLMQNLDPTPICGFEKRWKQRLNMGIEEHAGEPCWHLKLTWQDGTATDAWFSEQDGTLRGMLTEAPGFVQRRGFDDYKEFDGIYWPEQEKMLTEQAGETLITISKLQGLKVDSDKIEPITPENLTAMLEAKRAAGVLQGPGVDKKAE